MTTTRILVVEDELDLNRALLHRLATEGFSAEGVRTTAEARGLLGDDWDLVLLDMRLPDGDGLSFLREVQERRPELLVILMTAFSSIEDAVTAIKLGAYDYVRKPFDFEELLLRLRQALETMVLRREVRATRERSKRAHGLSAIVGQSQAVQEVRDFVRRVATSDATTVLVTGESGSGKDLVAKAIHHESRRGDGPFMTITCTAISEHLLESELFGHEKGAFTDARTQKNGLLELADGGTVFLDEIGDLPLQLQAKLLRFLQEKTFKRVGGTRDITVDVRVIAATHQPLPTLVKEGRFRQDLYYRLKVIDGMIPPLRERLDDVPLLARSFVNDLNRELRRDVRHISAEAEAAMLRYGWPGNVRELRNALERAMILGQGDTIRIDALPFEIRATDPARLPPAPAAARPDDGRGGTFGSEVQGGRFIRLGEGFELETLERELLTQAMAVASGNKTRAGRLLGLNRDQVRYRLEKYGLLEQFSPQAAKGAGTEDA
ncbi:MAG: sigma-54 dependent transcriptional regulator [Planctomycetes bacterium]|nr:sigma-54 dependent transcriptional regulator [Planctomycetota bacterium]